MSLEAKYGRSLKVFCLCVLLLAVFGCAALTSAQQAKLDKMQADLKTAAEQVRRIYDLQADVRQKYKDGELGAVEAVGVLAELQEEAQHALANYEKLQQDYRDLKGSGIPWYHWLWTVASTIAAAWFGKEKFALIDGIGLLIRSVEKSKDVASVKKKVADAGNERVNRLVRKLT